MTLYVWAEIRDELTTAYGAGLGAKLEQDLIVHFKGNPARFVSEGRDVAHAFQRGTVTSGWGSLRWRLDKASEQGDITAEDTTAQKQAVKRAEQWIRAAGMHYDRWGEADDELFGSMGQLRHWAEDRQLRQRMESLWLEVRPDGERTEQEAVDRAERHKQAHPVGDPPAGRPEPVPTPEWGPKLAVATIDPDMDIPF